MMNLRTEIQKVGSGLRNKMTGLIDGHITQAECLCGVVRKQFSRIWRNRMSLFALHGLCNGSLPLYKTDVHN